MEVNEGGWSHPPASIKRLRPTDEGGGVGAGRSDCGDERDAYLPYYKPNYKRLYPENSTNTDFKVYVESTNDDRLGNKSPIYLNHIFAMDIKGVTGIQRLRFVMGNKDVVFVYGGEHLYKQCDKPTEISCINCSGPHLAISRLCPIKIKKISEKKSNISYASVALTKQVTINETDFPPLPPPKPQLSTKGRGQELFNLIDDLDLCILNDGRPTTLNRPRQTASAIDVSFISGSLAPLCEWSVHDDTMGSYHYPTITEISLDIDKYHLNSPVDRFIYKKADWETYTDL
ncbi:unnamed protein product [Pieris macdunnoughi]|uniref:Endonuclease/exonuclease/phosphatase domain-containing protein n=1 Tax=Pieris macdunnoughi TaxID=345717 RepID=A0A821XU21_9NEOP|nr:unnamed protein product [Pieris macdunnoughi]